MTTAEYEQIAEKVRRERRHEDRIRHEELLSVPHDPPERVYDWNPYGLTER